MTRGVAIVRRKIQKPNNVAAYSDFLMHYGIKGQQWGLRRYQNEDGTLTEEGKLRYNEGQPESEGWKKRDAKYLSDEELRRRTNRLQQEQNYKNLMTSESERNSQQIKNDFKKKLITAIAVTPVIAILGIASKKYLGKALSLVGNFAKKKMAPYKAAGMIKNTLKNPFNPSVNTFTNAGKITQKIGKGMLPSRGPKIYENGVYANPLLNKRVFWRGLGSIRG